MNLSLATPALAFAIFINIASASYCNKLAAIYSPEPQYVSVNGVNRPLSLYWGSDPARATSALLLVVLRYALGYQNVRLRRGPHRLQDLIQSVGHNNYGNYNETIMALSTAWQPTPISGWTAESSMTVGLAGPRFEEFGVSGVPVIQRLHAHLADDFKNNLNCTNITHWKFFTNLGLLKSCGFFENALSSKAVVYEVETDEETLPKSSPVLLELKARADAHGLHLQYEKLNRTSLFQLLRTSNHSFLFVDYDMWVGRSGHLDYPDVRAVKPPPCILSAALTCQQELDSAIAMRVADMYYVKEYAPLIMQLAHNFNPSHDILREILEEETRLNNVTEAACKWAVEHNSAVINWKSYHGNVTYRILLYYDDPILEELMSYLQYKFERTYKIHIKYPLHLMTGKSDDFVKKRIFSYMNSGVKQSVIGAVVGGVTDLTSVAKTLEGSSLPVLLYEPADVDNNFKSVWSATGNSYQQALALNHFIQSMNWTRVAVLSEETDTAKSLIKHLKNIGDFALRDHRLKLNLTSETAVNALKEIQFENAYIIFVNTNYKDAATILSAAQDIKMNGSQYAWIVRDWRPDNKTKNTKHITLSFSSRHITDVSRPTNGLREGINLSGWIKPPDLWPPQTTVIADAILSLINGFRDVILHHPLSRYDTRGSEVMQYFNESLNGKSFEGVTQTLKYKGQSLEEVVVFIEEWHGDQREVLALWWVNATSRTVKEEKRRDAYEGNPPKDGASRCFLQSGDLYSRICYDVYWAIALFMLLMAVFIMVLGYWTMQRRIKKQAEEHERKLRTWRDESTAALSAFLVDRSALELRHELGSGRFGCVRLGVLRLKGSVPRAVAAKALRNPQEEGEILREACTLASLDHEYIIRLIGVCIDDKPPLVLMDVAFFGDLRQYLQDRRYLVENSIFDSDTDLDKGSEEATHVSAQALTRLARQAASALGYLSLRGVIHRDLRASNCLVDANRSLKLADFGMARATAATNMDGGTEYACRRRGLFPVLWMAPESLEQGVFSTASDVWALGVLVFELVTLGARPFGDMSPLRVMQFVAAGNKPPMPRDATPQTNALAQLCWRREPEERPTAAEIVAYLAERPYALRPALICEHDPLANPDSGFGDSPMSELLP